MNILNIGKFGDNISGLRTVLLPFTHSMDPFKGNFVFHFILF